MLSIFLIGPMHIQLRTLGKCRFRPSGGFVKPKNFSKGRGTPPPVRHLGSCFCRTYPCTLKRNRHPVLIFTVHGARVRMSLILYNQYQFISKYNNYKWGAIFCSCPRAPKPLATPLVKIKSGSLSSEKSVPNPA